MDQLEHAAGIISLAMIAILAASGSLSLYVIVAAIRPQWRRILRLAAGDVTASPAASDAPLASAPLPQRRGVEAAAAPTHRSAA